MMKPDDVMALIKGRRSCRSYKPDAVPEKVIDRILEAGTWAPSAMNKQPWKFIVITDRQVIRDLSDRVKKAMLGNAAVMSVARYAERFTASKDLVFYGAPLLIFIIGDEKDEWMPVDTGLCAQNMFLYAYSEGLASCWIGFSHQLNKDPEALKKLKVPAGNKIQGAFIFGYPAEKMPPHDRNKPVVIA